MRFRDLLNHDVLDARAPWAFECPEDCPVWFLGQQRLPVVNNEPRTVVRLRPLTFLGRDDADAAITRLFKMMLRTVRKTSSVEAASRSLNSMGDYPVEAVYSQVDFPALENGQRLVVSRSDFAGTLVTSPAGHMNLLVFADAFRLVVSSMRDTIDREGRFVDDLLASNQ